MVYASTLEKFRSIDQAVGVEIATEMRNAGQHHYDAECTGCHGAGSNNGVLCTHCAGQGHYLIAV